MRFGLNEDIINTINEIFEANSKVDKAIVFGSRAKGNYRPDSDIDIAVKGFDLTLDDILKMQVAFEEKGIEYKIDLIDYSTIKEKALIEHFDRVGIEMYSRWKKHKLGDIVTLNYGKALKEENRQTGSVPVYSSAGITGYHNEAMVNSQAIIIGRKGTIGKVYYSSTPFCCIDTAYYILPDERRYKLRFLFYLLQTLGLEELNSDSAVPGLNREAAYSQEILLPPLPEQTAISEMLSSIDNKIDLLYRQNKTLEQLAEALFRQRFVEDIEAQNVRLGDVVKTTSGGTPSRNKMEYYSSGTIYWVKSKELAGSFIFETEEMITEDALRNSSAKLLPANSILIAMYGATVGEFGILANEATCNQAICALIPNDNYPYTYLFMLTKFNKENLLNLAVGSAQQNISQLLIKEINVSSNNKLIREFHNETEAFFKKIKSNAKQIRALTQLRNTLLPKLMSGEVRVDLTDTLVSKPAKSKMTR